MKIANKQIFLFLLLMPLFLSSCQMFFNGKNNDKVIAVAGGNELLFSQFKMVIPANLSEIDSISYAQNYIEKWVKNQLLREKAELHLDKTMLSEIEIMLENYKTSLMVFQYQQMLIQQKMDTLISDEQVDTYYEQNAGNFRLDSNVVRAIFVKIPKAVHDSYVIRNWIRSSNEDDIISLEDYCYQHANNFDMGTSWIYLGQLLQVVPKRIDDQRAFLLYNRNIETSDSIYRYFVNVVDYKLVGDTTPIDFIKPQIRSIIYNRRKMKFIDDLENNIYRDAVNQKKFTIHAN